MNVFDPLRRLGPVRMLGAIALGAVLAALLAILERFTPTESEE